jgi:hypothetical protein
MAAISPIVRALIAERISSIAQLELILLLRHAPQRWWSPDDVHRELRTDPAWLHDALRELCAWGVCEQSPDPPPRFRYKPKNAALQQSLDDLAHDYLVHRVSIVELIYSKPSAGIRAFSDAFDLRKRGGHG